MQRASSTARGYGSRWQRERLNHLRAEPACRMCAQLGVTTAATVVDHIVAPKGNEALFWDPGNWQSLCKPCHDSVKQSQERTGILRGCDVDGVPVDPAHHWRG